MCLVLRTTIFVRMHTQYLFLLSKLVRSGLLFSEWIFGFLILPCSAYGLYFTLPSFSFLERNSIFTIYRFFTALATGDTKNSCKLCFFSKRLELNSLVV